MELFCPKLTSHKLSTNFVSGKERLNNCSEGEKSEVFSAFLVLMVETESAVLHGSVQSAVLR